MTITGTKDQPVVSDVTFATQDEAINGLNDTYFSNIKLWYLKEVKKQEIKEITEELDEKNPKSNEVIKKRKI